MSKFLFKISGSIAAFKACTVISALVKEGHEVQCVASAAALKFIGAATLEGLSGKPVITSAFAHGHHMDHIALNRWADAILFCPASAHSICGLAAGTAEDPLGAFFLAHDFSKPYLIAPAMNQAMWAHPATQAALGTLKSWGIRILEGEAGALACGEEGMGRMAEPDAILAALREEKLR